MPHLRIKGMNIEDIKRISRPMIDDLEDLLKCPRDYFVIEAAGSKLICDGEIVDGDPFVEVSWFDRGTQKQDSAAQIITGHIKECGYSDVDIYFNLLEERRYYSNGQHC